MKITVWEVFFLLLTIIPVSRMFSTIFMKFIVRVGTVNEEKWAARGTAGITSIAGLVALNSFMRGMGVRSPGPAQMVGGSSSGAGGGTFSGMGGGSSPAIMPNFNMSQPGRPDLGSYNISKSPSGLYLATGQNQSAGYSQPQSALDDILHNSDNVNRGSRMFQIVGGAMGTVAGESGFAAGSMLFGITGRSLVNTTETVTKLSGALRKEMVSGSSFKDAVQKITGANSYHQGVSRMVTSSASSLLGSKRLQRAAVNIGDRFFS